MSGEVDSLSCLLFTLSANNVNFPLRLIFSSFSPQCFKPLEQLDTICCLLESALLRTLLSDMYVAVSVLYLTSGVLNNRAVGQCLSFLFNSYGS